MRCAFLTTDDLTGYTTDDQLAADVLQRRGWAVDEIPWRRAGVDWSRYAVVVIRSTWDYHKSSELFLRTLASIDASGARLENPHSIVRWNAAKTYLGELALRGIRTVPTIWARGLGEIDLVRACDEWMTEEVVVKPVVSASAADTFRIHRSDSEEARRSIEGLFRERDLMVQPFIRAIVDEGEFSLFYFDGEYSHAILKKPKDRDFRVQEEHGASITAVEPTAAMRAVAEEVMKRIDQALLYARVDLVRVDATFALMELELVEPALYFRTASGSAERFAATIERRASITPRPRAR